MYLNWGGDDGDPSTPSRAERPIGAAGGRRGMGHSGRVERDSPKSDWVSDLPSGESLKDGLARLVDADDDEAEREYYEAAADPEFVALEREQRRYRGAFTRRMRRMGAKRRQR